MSVSKDPPRLANVTGPRSLALACSLLCVGALASSCAPSKQVGAPHSSSATAPSTTSGSPTSSSPTPGPVRPCGTAARSPAHYQHVVWIWMENHSWSSVIGSSEAPYITTLAHECGTDTDYAVVGAPSLPNYLGATSGSTQGVNDDGDPTAHTFAVDNLFRQVRTAGGSERSFVESMPSNCALVSKDSYATKHNPAAYYVGPGDRAACDADDQPFTQFATILASGNLPTYTSITPNICNDTHDCSVATGDTWLATWVPRILASAAYHSG